MIIKRVKNIVARILATVVPKLWQKFCSYRFASENDVRLRFLPNSVWIIKKGNYRDLVLKLPKDAFLPWHVLNFVQIFDSFEAQNGVIDISVPTFLTMKKNQKQFFLFQTPEDDHVAKGYLGINKPNKNDIVFDIGAAYGVMSYIYSSLCKRVCAFEPNPYTYAALCTNIVHHKLYNVTPYIAGIWLKTEEIDFSTNLGGGDVILKEEIRRDLILEADRGVVNTTRVKGLNIEDAIMLTECFPTHIKMDIEGAELEIIKGNLDFIAKHNFKFAIACYHIIGGERTAERLIELFKSIGYKTELVYPEHLTLHAWKEK
jgi:FkbM family methyltransferase